MNNHLPTHLRDALNGSVRLPREPEVEAIHVGGTNLESANDGEPAYIRMPELDRRVAWGDLANANAWFSTAKRKAVYLCVNFNPLDGKWLPIVQSVQSDGGTSQ